MEKILFYLRFFLLKPFDNTQTFFYLTAPEKPMKNIRMVSTQNIIYSPLTCTFVKKGINMLYIVFMYFICFTT